MYTQAKSCVLVDGAYSDFFQTNAGVRQGENLSPLLFALYLNDLKDTLNVNMDGLVTLEREGRNLNMDDANVFLKMFIFCAFTTP